jgi:hypothetical protein
MERNYLIKRVLLLALIGLPVSVQAEWFQDPDTGCTVWGDHSQPIVKIHWSGDCVDGKASGKGLMEVFIDGIPFSSYEGEYRDGKADGYGVLNTPGEARYEGEFKNNNMHGHGVIISVDGKRLEGNYLNGLPHGTMVVTSPDGTRVEIEFDHGNRVK